MGRRQRPEGVAPTCRVTSRAARPTGGGGVRVGLEDGIYLDHRREQLATNADLVERVHQSMQLLGRRVMTSAEYRVTVLGR
jgi:uncharacterized protein (DUF849 family)